MPSFQARVFYPDGVRTQRVDAPDRQSVAALLGVAPQHVLAVEELSADPADLKQARGRTQKL
ncbi:hypothetical protein ACVBEH_27085, partial [Roseateles sp. GG27B]